MRFRGEDVLGHRDRVYRYTREWEMIAAPMNEDTCSASAVRKSMW